MVIDASASALAFYGARVGLADDAWRLGHLAVALDDGTPVSESEAIAAIERGPTPLRITGDVTEAILRLHLSPVGADPEALKQFHIRKGNLGDHIFGIDPAASDDVALLVIAFRPFVAGIEGDLASIQARLLDRWPAPLVSRRSRVRLGARIWYTVKRSAERSRGRALRIPGR